MPSYIIMDGGAEFIRGDGRAVAPDGMVVVEVPEPAANWEVKLVGDDYVISPLPRELEKLGEDKMREISSAFAVRSLQGCATPKGWADCDEAAQRRVSGVIQLREKALDRGLPIEPEVKWTMFDKSKVFHNDDELDLLGIAIGLGFSAIFSHKQELEDMVAAAVEAGDRAAIEAINPAIGWP